ncbi:MAG: glycogen/starch/alpha-glucan phosphorylase, partial [Clostridiales bacterium]|nr:glycogen/starch/alpha-glucan phosphorylase [Clostridiales bacterium]
MYLDKESFKKDFENKLMLMFSESVEHASFNNKYMAFGTLIRDYMSKNWHNTGNQYFRDKNKQVYYFSLEFLIGKLLDANLINLGIRDVCHEGLAELGISLTELEDVEPDAGLGNGGLGRLAACFLDSMASMGIPGVGNGIRYKYGLFEQKIVNGYQIESPDNWLKVNNIWEIRRDHEACIVKFGGEVSMVWDDGSLKASHTGYEPILAVPYDMPIPGYDNNTVNTLRLWSAEVTGLDFDFSSFSRGDYEKASEQQHAAANITYVLYPDDSTEKGKLLRLKQEYFFTSAGVQSIVSNVKKMNGSAAFLDRYAAIQINDTHP